MIAKIIIILLLIGIVASLFTGLFFLLRDPSSSRRTVWALTLRVGLSITLLIFLAIAYTEGWIHPHGVGG
jgi:Protein of unknown function (DUF2909).